jgi:hypothetical protein
MFQERLHAAATSRDPEERIAASDVCVWADEAHDIVACLAYDTVPEVWRLARRSAFHRQNIAAVHAALGLFEETCETPSGGLESPAAWRAFEAVCQRAHGPAVFLVVDALTDPESSEAFVGALETMRADLARLAHPGAELVSIWNREIEVRGATMAFEGTDPREIDVLLHEQSNGLALIVPKDDTWAFTVAAEPGGAPRVGASSLEAFERRRDPERTPVPTIRCNGETFAARPVVIASRTLSVDLAPM